MDLLSFVIKLKHKLFELRNENVLDDESLAAVLRAIDEVLDELKKRSRRNI